MIVILSDRKGRHLHCTVFGAVQVRISAKGGRPPFRADALTGRTAFFSLRVPWMEKRDSD